MYAARKTLAANREIAYLIWKKVWPTRLQKEGIKENTQVALSLSLTLVDSSLVETLASYDRA